MTNFRLIPKRPGDQSHNDYETPASFFALCNATFGPFTLDACARPETAKCPQFYSLEDSCLQHSYHGTAWCNPPYSEDAIGPIIEHALTQARRTTASTLCLFPAKKSEQAWYHEFVAQAATMILPVQGRISFLLNGETQRSPNHTSVLVWYRAGRVGLAGHVWFPLTASFHPVSGLWWDIASRLRYLGLLGGET